MQHDAVTPTVSVTGMHGMGDNIHQRAAVRQLIDAGNIVYLETPWPCIYHDLVGERLKLISHGSSLRTQAKNAIREYSAFTNERPPAGTRHFRVSYTPQHVRDFGSVLHAMMHTCQVSGARADFRMPVPDSWHEEADVWLKRWKPTRPLMFYRPLQERSEWSGCRSRNPAHDHYRDLFESIAHRYFVVSVADLEQGKEWFAGHNVDVDVECHKGELTFQVMASLVSRASLVFTPPGFAVILAQSVGTPGVCVMGGYEDSRSFSAGAKFAPYLGIDTVRPCRCFRHDHRCDKRIDMPSALARLAVFSDEAIDRKGIDRP